MTASWPSRPRQIFQTTPLRDAVNREALANSRQHPEEELFKNSVVDDYTGSPSEELRWRHMGLVVQDRFFKQLLFGMLLAVGKLASHYSMYVLVVIVCREELALHRRSYNATREALANSRQHPEEELFKKSVVDDYTG